MAYIVNVRLLVDVQSEAEAYDAANEILRPLQREFETESCLVDYANDWVSEVSVDLDNYEEGEVF